MPEIAVEREDIAGVKLFGHADEAGIGEIGGGVTVFTEYFLNLTSAGGELIGNLKCSAGDVCQDVMHSTWNGLQQIAAFYNYRFAGCYGIA